MADKILEVTASRINAAVKKVEKLPEQGVTGADGKSAYQIWLEQWNHIQLIIYGENIQIN